MAADFSTCSSEGEERERGEDQTKTRKPDKDKGEEDEKRREEANGRTDVKVYQELYKKYQNLHN